MTSSSMKFRSLVIGAAMAAVASCAAASPLTVPPMPPGNPTVTLAASPLTVPPMPPGNPTVTLAASPLTVPPMPPGNPTVTA